MQNFNPRRALLSVSNKQGLIELANTLHARQVELVATGNTAERLRQAGLPVTEVSECTGFPEMLDGRVKTLHPAIHAGLLARGSQDSSALDKAAIRPFDLLVVNLYPFEQAVSRHDCDFHTAVEQIDIGGPAMIRSAAKNHEQVLVIVSPADYAMLGDCIEQQSIPDEWRFNLARKAFAHTAAYDAAISNYLSTLDNQKKPVGFPEIFTCQFHKKQSLRYGENPHQQAIFYRDKHPAPGTLAMAEVLQGKTLSYNNLLDADAAFDCVKSFANEQAACVIVKHGNPCGIALASSPCQAYLSAWQCDPASSYGGIIALNQTLDEETAQTILGKQFAEVIIAPAIEEKARKILATKPAIRLLITGRMESSGGFHLDMRRIDGGLLVQEHDGLLIEHNLLQTVTVNEPTAAQKKDLLFAWLAVKHVKSNAIVFAKEQATIGIGAGQTSRVMSTRIALWQAEQAGFSCQEAVMASDAFIPFPDSLELAASAGIRAIIQPGGSIRDAEVIAAADAAGISMIFTRRRHFRH